MKNVKPKVSIIASAARPKNWITLYESIGTNATPFELVFVGPNPPLSPLPDNFRFIQSNVKPAQCVEIAARNAQGDFLVFTGDDVFFKTKSPLDCLLNSYQTQHSTNLIVSSRFTRNGDDLTGMQTFFGDKRTPSPLMPMVWLIQKDYFFRLGGIDKNFIAIMYDLDIAMRVWTTGGEVILSSVEVEEDLTKSGGSTLCSDYWHHDRNLLLSLWTENKTRLLNRRGSAVVSFIDRGIQDFSQGPKGRWNHNIGLFSRLTTHPNYFKMRNLFREKEKLSRLLKRFRRWFNEN